MDWDISFYKYAAEQEKEGAVSKSTLPGDVLLDPAFGEGLPGGTYFEVSGKTGDGRWNGVFKKDRRSVE